MKNANTKQNVLIPKASRKRQWGTERETDPLSSVHNQPSSLVIAFSRLSIVLTLVFWAMYVTSVVLRQLIEGPQSYQFTVEVFGYLVVVTFLTFSALMYLIARQGALQRFSKHARAPRAVIDRHFSTHQSSITVLVPSYSEETEVIRKTILSAALQEYPDLRVVLLLDDNPFKVRPEDETRLSATRALSTEIKELLSEPYEHFSKALARIENPKSQSKKVTGKAVLEVAAQYMWAAEWLNDFADKEEIEDHVDVFFANQVLRELAKDLSLVGEALRASNEEGATLSYERIVQLYRRLVWIF
ncbi:MAG: glycosyltransferase family 2 protein, partial [Patescibacteria group bacterium]